MTTSPDSVSYPTQDYGVLGPFPALLVNVQDFGADPTGNDDSTLAIQDALDAAGQSENGGEVVLPPGVYKTTATLLQDPNTVLSGSGTIRGSAAEWRGARYRGLSNRNWEESVITDENLTIRGVTFDWTDMGSQGGLAHVIYIRRARNVTITGVTVRGGASSVALLGCDNTLEQGNSYFDSRNCLSDHWDNPRNAAVIGCYMEAGTLSISQMVNFNPEPSSLIGTGHVASGFVMTGCTLVSHEATSTPCQIEPLATGNTVENVTIGQNTFVNTYVVARGDVRGAAITANTFSGFLGDSAVIYVKHQFGVKPSAITISANLIRDPLTNSPAEGVIVAQSPSAIVSANTIMGVGYSTSSITGVGELVQSIANYVEKAPSVGRLQGGARVINGTSSYWGWTDTNGSSPRMYLQSDDNWLWVTTGSSGNDRTVASLQALSSSSELRWSIPHLFQGTTRHTPAAVSAAGTTIGSATQITANLNVVSASAGSTGVALNPRDGQDQTVINVSAVTIDVYPNNNGSAQIDAGGVGNPVTIAPGKSKTFTRVVANDFRTIAAT